MDSHHFFILFRLLEDFILLLHFVPKHNYLLLHLKSQLARRDWSTISATNSLEIILSLLCTLSLHRICISLQVWEKIIRMGEVETLNGAELESYSDKARPSDI